VRRKAFRSAVRVQASPAGEKESLQIGCQGPGFDGQDARVRCGLRALTIARRDVELVEVLEVNLSRGS
jgi:hypothetical protein